MTVTPPASASAVSPLRSDWQARWMATSEEEQAVSTVTAGPSRPRVYATRPEITLDEFPVSRYVAISAGITADPRCRSRGR